MPASTHSLATRRETAGHAREVGFREMVVVEQQATPIELQRVFWNEWNSANREQTSSLTKVQLEQADVILSWLRLIDRADLEILDVGCGAGWLCAELTPFGRVTGTDLSDEVLARARERVPQASFVAGNFMDIDFEVAKYDVAVSLEVLSHVADQQAFVRKISTLLKPGGYLMLATQNRSALERSAIPAPRPGQLRRWVDRSELEHLLEGDLQVEKIFTITPQFNRGVLRIVNSNQLRHLAKTIGLGGLMAQVKRAQEKAGLGWTLMARARKRGVGWQS
jgi:2-polyprenyl-3-methyl-5-hydroxy-6-metoxy-1,4-benzoquinol methylase